ncbi:MAG: hypothetical protein R2912_01690 [Eubacteriales bacterium]
MTEKESRLGEKFRHSWFFFPEDYSNRYENKYNGNFFCASFDLLNTTDHLIRFYYDKGSIKDMYLGLYDQDFSFINDSNDILSPELHPYNQQNFVFFVPEHYFSNVKIGTLKLTFTLTDRIGDNYEAKFDFLFTCYNKPIQYIAC